MNVFQPKMPLNILLEGYKKGVTKLSSFYGIEITIIGCVLSNFLKTIWQTQQQHIYKNFMAEGK